MSDDAERYGANIEDYMEELDGAPRKPRCTVAHRLCRPTVRIKPSGRRLSHSEECPDKPGQPIYGSEYIGAGTFRPTPWRGQ